MRRTQVHSRIRIFYQLFACRRNQASIGWDIHVCIGRLYWKVVAFEATTFTGAIARERHKDSKTELSTVPVLKKNGVRMWNQYFCFLFLFVLCIQKRIKKNKRRQWARRVEGLSPGNVNLRALLRILRGWLGFLRSTRPGGSSQLKKPEQSIQSRLRSLA